MTPDPFEHFDQEERSFSHIEEFGPQLGTEARQILNDQPGLGLADLVGVVFEAGTAEYRVIAELGKRGGGPPPPASGIVGVIPRRIADQILAQTAGSDGAGYVDMAVAAGRLPILVATKDGFRVGGVDVPAEW